MNIVNKLTLKHLKQNKRRTLVTIIGVIISVAMVTAVATLVVSFMDMMQRQTIAESGEWHVLYKGVNKDQLEAIKNDEATKTVIISRDKGYAFLDGSQNDYKPYLFIKEYDAQGFKHFPIDLTKGRLPQAADEIVLSEHIASNAKVQFELGDTLTLDIGERITTNSEGNQVVIENGSLYTKDGNIDETLSIKQTESFKIVGFIKRPTWEPTWAPGYTIISYVDENMIRSNDTVNASVVLNKVNRSLYEHATQLAEKYNLETPQYNRSLLSYYGVTSNDALWKTLISLSSIIMSIIMIGSVSLIYNAFAISVSERSRHLGMLASVGATKSQKRNSVFFEGAMIGLISIPIGIISGLVGIGITFYFINSAIQGVFGMTESLKVVVTPSSILVACAVSMLTIFISTYIPARRASKISAIDAIRQTTDVKLTRKAVKTSKLVRKLFGIEAEIGLKNLKRNKRRYRATVFSLVISILLFLTVSYFTDNLKKTLELSQPGLNFDIHVAKGGTNPKIDDQLMKSITSLEDVTEYSLIHELRVNAWIDQQSIADELQKWLQDDQSILKDGKYPYSININALGDENLKAYAKAIGADYEKLIDPEHFTAIVIDTISYRDENTGKYVETKAIKTKIGKTLDLVYIDWDQEEDTEINKIEITALTDQLPMGVYPENIGGLNIVISEQVMNQLNIDKDIADLHSYLYLKSADPLKTQQEIEEMKEGNMYVYNAYKNRQTEEQMIMILSVFTYGFIVLITAISIANIFNTISTSISLRKREFAMLKSVGMTPNGFNKMINYESIFYGIQSLLYGLPISLVAMYLIYRSLMHGFSFGFILPWASIFIVVITVFIIVGSSMLYSSSKIKRENIIDALKQESI